MTQEGQSAPSKGLATLLERAVAVIIDHIILFFLYLIILVPLGLLGALAGGIGFLLFEIPSLLISWILWLLYFSYFEATTGQTPGKRMLRIRTVNEVTLQPIEMGKAIVRNVLRIIDWLPFIYIIGVILIASSEKRKRLGDIGADSIVIKV